MFEKIVQNIFQSFISKENVKCQNKKSVFNVQSACLLEWLATNLKCN